ncbi:hypothetical protein PsYK624_029080 [Phanerochaete sordida]|uniref:Uncharacterized protein n=1 Tax=Phanerochaete sordida TaxID=48140 RepID=A0A9P3G2S2_9APHY|nr:hypothetical protein PsYK624_029080 [Phanerochaete sordida]
MSKRRRLRGVALAPDACWFLTVTQCVRCRVMVIHRCAAMPKRTVSQQYAARVRACRSSQNSLLVLNGAYPCRRGVEQLSGGARPPAAASRFRRRTKKWMLYLLCDDADMHGEPVPRMIAPCDGRSTGETAARVHIVFGSTGAP